MDGPPGNNGDSTSEGGGESSAAGSAEERWTCEACGCNTNLESDRSCTICGTSRSDGTFQILLYGFLHNHWFLLSIICTWKSLVPVTSIMRLLLLKSIVTSETRMIFYSSLICSELSSFILLWSTNRSSNIEESWLCRKGIRFVR